MFSLVLVALVVGVALVVLFLVGGLYVQGYLYTDVSPGLYWQAPTAAALLTLFYFSWCWLNTSSPGASPADLPYDTLLRFSTEVEMNKEPVRKLWAVKKGVKEPVEHEIKKYVTGGFVRHEYRDKARPDRTWSSLDVTAVLIEHNGEKLRFTPQAAGDGEYRVYVNDQGWEMREYESGVTGLPIMMRTSRLLAVLALNGVHWLLWFLSLWLLLRFQWEHALLGSFLFWAALTVLVLPMLLTEAVILAGPAATTT